jgi:hypothetical protein
MKTNVDQFLEFGPSFCKFFDKLHMHIISGVQLTTLSSTPNKSQNLISTPCSMQTNKMNFLIPNFTFTPTPTNGQGPLKPNLLIL